MAGQKRDESKEISVSDAGDRLGELVERVRFGREVITITRYDKPVAKLVPIEAA